MGLAGAAVGYRVRAPAQNGDPLNPNKWVEQEGSCCGAKILRNAELRNSVLTALPALAGLSCPCPSFCEAGGGLGLRDLARGTWEGSASFDPSGAEHRVSADRGKSPVINWIRKTTGYWHLGCRRAGTVLREKGHNEWLLLRGLGMLPVQFVLPRLDREMGNVSEPWPEVWAVASVWALHLVPFPGMLLVSGAGTRWRVA